MRPSHTLGADYRPARVAYRQTIVEAHEEKFGPRCNESVDGLQTRGAHDLSLVAGELRDTGLDVSASVELETRSVQVTEHGSATDQLFAPNEWRRLQLIRLFAASVLQSYLKNVRGERLSRFNLEKHPDGITLGQLARMHEGHPGVVGQTFEFAVADAVNAGVPEVVEPLRKGLRNLGMQANDPVGIILLGLEKVAPADRERVFSLVADALPSGASLRSARRGRPMGVGTLLERISEASWISLSADERRAAEAEDNPVRYRPDDYLGRQSVSQLGRADALVYCGDVVVAASMKVNPRHVPGYGWRDVPLWITTSGRAGYTARRLTGPLRREVIQLPRPFDYGGLLQETVNGIDDVMRSIDLGRPLRVFALAPWSSAAEILWRSCHRYRNAPLAELIDHLRGTADEVARAAALTAVSSDNQVIQVPVLDNASVRDAHLQQALDGTLFKLQNQLFVPSG